jgi:hypothetical protein
MLPAGSPAHRPHQGEYRMILLPKRKNSYPLRDTLDIVKQKAEKDNQVRLAMKLREVLEAKEASVEVSLGVSGNIHIIIGKAWQ